VCMHVGVHAVYLLVHPGMNVCMGLGAHVIFACMHTH
jgi:hypothetical protein